MSPDFWSHYVIDHVTRSGWFPICASLTPTLYLVRFTKY